MKSFGKLFTFLVPQVLVLGLMFVVFMFIVLTCFSCNLKSMEEGKKVFLMFVFLPLIVLSVTSYSFIESLEAKSNFRIVWVISNLLWVPFYLGFVSYAYVVFIPF
jgi:hypothetical protein